MLVLATLARAEPVRVDPAGTDRLDEIAELRFSLTYVYADHADTHSWTWRPVSGEVRSGSAGWVLGHADTDEARALERSFLADTFWLAPELHLAWGGAALLTDRGAAEVDGWPLRWAELRYPSGGYTPGDAHDLLTDADGRLVAWRYRPGGGDVALVARFEGVEPVGPLRVARVREVTGDPALREVRVDALDFTPAGSAISAGGGTVVAVGPEGCRLGSARVTRSGRAPVGQAPLDRPPDRVATVKIGGDTRSEGWSSASLALADPTWLFDSGVLSCDFGVLDEDALRSALSPLSSEERALAVAVLWGWAWGTGTLPQSAAWLAPALRKDAAGCAATGDCERLYAGLRRVSPPRGETARTPPGTRAP